MIYVVGIGPGNAALRTAAADRALREAEVLWAIIPISI